MALIGGRDTRDFVVYTGVDAAELARLSLQDGTTLEAVTGLLAGALAGVAGELNASPLSTAWFVSNSPEVSYRMGGDATLEVRSEYARPERVRAELEGSMLPLLGFDKALGWTWDYLRKAYSAQIDADIQVAVNAIRNIVRQQTLRRVVRKTDDTGASMGLGASGISPGFATTAASTGVDFTPPSYAGVSFANTHEHYAIGAASITNAALLTDSNNLREHGHMPPFDLWIAPANEATVRALTTFVAAGDPILTVATTSPTVVLPEGYIGYLTESRARVRVIDGMPTDYLFMFKSYGSNNPLNPLRLRLGAGETSLRAVAFPEPNSGTSPASPLGTLIVWTEFGVGVGDRTNGVPHRSNAAWADGTPS